MTRDEADVRQVLANREKAIQDRNAEAAIATTALSLVTFDLQPPLVSRGAAARSAADLNAWFGTWDGPINIGMPELEVILSGDLAVAFGLTQLRGVGIRDEPHQSWFRSTFALSKGATGWQIVHEHHSYPMHMDGSTRAAIDLQPVTVS